MPKDNLGREVGNVSANDLLSDVGKPTTAGAVGKAGNPEMEKVASILAQLDKNITKGQVQSEKYLKEIATAYKKSGNKELQKMAKAGLKPGSLHTSDKLTHDMLNKMMGQISKLPAGGGAVTPGKSFGKTAGADMAAEFSQQMNTGKWWKKIASRLSAIGAQTLGGIDILQATMGGVVRDSIDFNIQLKQIGYQTQGVTKDTKGLVNNWVDLNDVSARTGVNLTQFQQSYTKNIRKGVSSLKESGEVLKASLNLSTMIGSNAEQTADTLHDWHVQMGLTQNETADLTRGIQMVAQESGVVGDNLMQAVKSSEKFVKNMRNAGTLTSKAASEMILLVAEAQKLGIADQMDRVLESTTDVNKLFFGSAQETKNLLFQAAASAGKLDELTTGTLMSTRSGKKGFAEGLDKIIGGFNTTFEDVSDLPVERLRDINLALQQTFGMNVMEMKKLRDGTLSGTQSLAEMQKELKKGNLTLGERTALEEKLRKTGAARSMQVLSNFSEIAKAAKTTEGAMTKWLDKLGPEMKKDVGEFAKAAGMALKTPTDHLAATLLFNAEQLKKAGGPDMVEEMKKIAESGDKDIMRQGIENLTKANEKTGVKQIKQLDPMTEMAQTLTEINNVLRAFLGPMATGILQFAGPMGLFALQAGPAIQGILGMTSMFKGGGLKKIGAGMFSGKIGKSLGALPKDICDCAGGAAAAGAAAGGGGGVARRELSLGKKAVPMATLKTMTKGGMPIIQGARKSRFEQLKGRKKGGGIGGMLKGLFKGKGKGKGKGLLGGLLGMGSSLLGLGGGGGGGMLGAATSMLGGGAGADGVVPVEVVGGGGIGGGDGGIMDTITDSITGGKGGGKGGILKKFGLKGLLGVAGKIAGPLAIATTAFGALKGAMGGAANAADIHGIAEDKLSTSHKVSAGAAGAATGALNSLTFGFFEKQLGPKGTWTKATAGFFQGAWKDMKGIFSGKTFGDRAKNLGKTFLNLTGVGLAAKGIMSLFGGGGGKKKIKVPKAEHGGIVGKTGLAEIHKDERIIPKGAAGGANKGGGGLLGGLGMMKYMIPIIGPMLAMGDMMSGKGPISTLFGGGDMHDKVRKDRAEGATGKQDTELAQLKEINNGIKQLVGMMSGPDQVGVPPGQDVGSTASVEKGASPPDYGMWPAGRTGANTTKEFI